MTLRSILLLFIEKIGNFLTNPGRGKTATLSLSESFSFLSVFHASGKTWKFCKRILPIYFAQNLKKCLAPLYIKVSRQNVSIYQGPSQGLIIELTQKWLLKTTEIIFRRSSSPVNTSLQGCVSLSFLKCSKLF